MQYLLPIALHEPHRKSHEFLKLLGGGFELYTY